MWRQVQREFCFITNIWSFRRELQSCCCISLKDSGLAQGQGAGEGCGAAPRVLPGGGGRPCWYQPPRPDGGLWCPSGQGLCDTPAFLPSSLSSSLCSVVNKARMLCAWGPEFQRREVRDPHARKGASDRDGSGKCPADQSTRAGRWWALGSRVRPAKPSSD